MQGRFACSDVVADVFMYCGVHVSIFHEIYRQILVHPTFLWCYRQTEEMIKSEFKYGLQKLQKSSVAMDPIRGS